MDDFPHRDALSWIGIGATFGVSAVLFLSQLQVWRCLDHLRKKGARPTSSPPPFWHSWLLVLPLLILGARVSARSADAFTKVLRDASSQATRPNDLYLWTEGWSRPLIEPTPLFIGVCLVLLVDWMFRMRQRATREHPLMMAFFRAPLQIATVLLWVGISFVWPAASMNGRIGCYVAMHVTGLSEMVANLMFGMDAPQLLSWIVVAFVAVATWLSLCA